MRGWSKNLRTLSSSSHSVLPKKLFGPIFCHKMWPLSLFFGLLSVYRSLPVTRHDSNPAHDTVQLFNYHFQKKSGRYLASSGPQLPHKNRPSLKKSVTSNLYPLISWKYKVLYRSIFQGKAGAHLGLKLYFCVVRAIFRYCVVMWSAGRKLRSWIIKFNRHTPSFAKSVKSGRLLYTYISLVYCFWLRRWAMRNIKFCGPPEDYTKHYANPNADFPKIYFIFK